MRHSPGPWRVGGFSSIEDADENPILMRHHAAAGELDQETERANAELAALAPELLETVIEFLGFECDSVPGCGHCMVCRANALVGRVVPKRSSTFVITDMVTPLAAQHPAYIAAGLKTGTQRDLTPKPRKPR